MHVDLSLNISVDFVPSSYEQDRGDGRMMADLFSINRTTINEPLESLTKDGVESLIDIEV